MSREPYAHKGSQDCHIARSTWRLFFCFQNVLPHELLLHDLRGSVSLALLPSPPWILSASSWGPGFGPGPVLSRSPGDAGPLALRPLGRRGHPRLSLSAIHTEKTLPPPRALCAVLLSLGPTLGEAAFPSSSPALPPARIPVPLPQYSRSCLCCSSCCWPSPDPEPSFTLMQ